MICILLLIAVLTPKALPKALVSEAALVLIRQFLVEETGNICNPTCKADMSLHLTFPPHAQAADVLCK